MTSPAVAPQNSPAFPLRLGDAADFGCVSGALRDVSFHEDTICQVLGIPSMAELGTARRSDNALPNHPSGALALFIRLFLFVDAVPSAVVADTIDSRSLAAFVALDLLRSRTGATGVEEYYSPVFLYPVAGLLLASDRYENPDGSPFVPTPDAVFPAIFAGTLRFLRIIPRSAAWDVLDLCAGTGVAALALSHHARRAVAADITARAAHFAQFNRLLNGCRNVEVATGDLYGAVPGQTFDLIVAHPPYVPAASITQIFRDGGETGEAILQRIVAGLPEFLRPGGAFYALCAGWDTQDGSFEDRVRQWLGRRHEEFDIVFAVHHQMSPADVARGLAQRASNPESQRPNDWRVRFDAARVERRVYGALVLERRTTDSTADRSPVITRRLGLSALTDGVAFERLLHWLRWRGTRESRGELARELLRVAPRLSPHLRVNVAYIPQPVGLAAADVVLETDRPFASLTRIDPWMLALLARFDGTHRAEQVYASAREAGELAAGFAAYDFTALLALMMERGYLELEGGLLTCRPPVPAVSSAPAARANGGTAP